MSVYRWKNPTHARVIHCGICSKRARTKTQIDGVFVPVCDRCYESAVLTAQRPDGRAFAEEIASVVRTMYRLSKGKPV